MQRNVQPTMQSVTCTTLLTRRACHLPPHLQKHEKARQEHVNADEVDENFIRLYWEQMLQVGAAPFMSGVPALAGLAGPVGDMPALGEGGMAAYWYEYLSTEAVVELTLARAAASSEARF
jgi:hypothetical protein